LAKGTEMQHNFTLKQAVITALTMLTIGAQNNALALGLGNIDVRSNLGHPLRASVKILGASELKGDDCFRIINDSSTENQLSKANFKLSKVIDDVATLTITTSQIINEPITNLSIMAGCDANIRRDYVLLLDPPLSAENENTTVEESTALEQVVAKESTVVSKAPPQTVKAPIISTKNSASKKQKANKNTNKNIVLTAGYGIEKTPAESTPKTEANKPRLSISGGTLNLDANLNNPNLRLDKQLHFTPETAPQALASDIEMQDEVTVLNKRMMHLEQQISTLALANKKLKTDNEAKTQRLEQADASSKKLDWLGYMLAGGLILGSLTIAEKLRRRRQIDQLQKAQLAWSNKSEAANEFDSDDAFFEQNASPILNSTTNQTVEKNDAPIVVSVDVAPISVQEFNDDQNILDHADVFLSHGRTSLAIQLLQNHLLDHPKQSVTIWLFLLDLLAKENMQAAYEQTTLECKEHFNIRIAAFTNDEASPKQHFEDFPRLTSGLQDVWGTSAALVYLDDLIYNGRLETRIGFEKSVLDELLLLKSVAHNMLNTAEVIQLDEKKLAMKEQKDAQIAAKKAEKLEMMEELVITEEMEKQALAKQETKEAMFEFNLVEYNKH
jgi:hypothetical protein